MLRLQQEFLWLLRLQGTSEIYTTLFTNGNVTVHSILAVHLTVELIFFLFCLLLIYAVIKNKRLALIPCMVWMLIDIIGYCVLAVFVTIDMILKWQPVYLIQLAIIVCFFGIKLVCFIVIKTHYQLLATLKRKENELEKVEYFQFSF
ncbi:uncharacterized protein LOC111619745 isoform X2 [Centruroides sculpturatus]|uniref:uncharacterized protein LOC111619745 isoform X2 n=1 Tax=Centruroides sculpturatus TaxID=218467 RepID=UPI000C6E8B3A|nr:uncharacterized protein LOC111619745 isoform X2 [Centruroides sculpturatus]